MIRHRHLAPAAYAAIPAMLPSSVGIDQERRGQWRLSFGSTTLRRPARRDARPRARATATSFCGWRRPGRYAKNSSIRATPIPATIANVNAADIAPTINARAPRRSCRLTAYLGSSQPLSADAIHSCTPENWSKRALSHTRELEQACSQRGPTAPARRSGRGRAAANRG